MFLDQMLEARFTRNAMNPYLLSFASRLQEKLSAATKSTTGVRQTAGVATICVALWAGGLLCPLAQAQTSEWAWMGGSNVIPSGTSQPGPPGVYGTLGVASATNVPGGRFDAVSWTDKQGNLWLFGGRGEDAVENYGFLNDLWEFNVTTKEWTWMSGSSTLPGNNGGGRPGVYGQLGIPGTNNTPGGRFGAFGWTDQQGNLWLFGGGGFDSTGATIDYLNDLWEYNIVSGEWTWMGGSSTVGILEAAPGIYGTLGSLTSGSYPGGRGWGVVWTDPQGSFWMFGGFGADSQGLGNDLNDLWKFVPSTRQWAWMSGNSTIGGTGWLGVYGQLGTPASGNTPGARNSSGVWVDAGGNMWLFGGEGRALTSGGQTYTGPLNDLWEFSATTNEWAWMGGSNLIGSSGASPGVSGTLGTFSAANIPGARSAPVVWVDSAGNAWLIGGTGYGAANTSGYLDDVWEFNPATNEWAWMGGPSALTVRGGESGVYGTLGVAGAGNIPGGRDEAASWTGRDGSFWLMGGEGIDANGAFGYLNDLWEYGAAAAEPTFSVPAGTYTSVQTVTLSDTTSGATIYYTINGTTPTTSSTAYTAPITVSTSETIEAIAVAGGFAPSAVSSASYIINLPPPSFTFAASPIALTVDAGGSGTSMVTVTPLNGFNSTVSFACSGLPSGVTCSFSPPTVTPSGSAVSSQLTISASAQARLERRGSHRNPGLWLPDSTLALAACLLVWRKRQSWRLSAILLIAFLGAGILSGCATVSTPPAPETLNVTVTATSGTLQQTSQLTLTVN
jgi:N-acetylneuraminic acid mutarotase